MEFTVEQLRAFNGSDPIEKPIYIAICFMVYDVTSGHNFYGPGGPYAVFTILEASLALAKTSKNKEDISGNLDGLTKVEFGVLVDYERIFQAKYPFVGRLSS